MAGLVPAMTWKSMYLRRTVIWLVIALVAITFAVYWRTIIFVSMVLFYTAWHRLFG
jgi:hypothetical protein